MIEYMKTVDMTPIVEQYPGKWVVLDRESSMKPKVLAAHSSLDKAMEMFLEKYGDNKKILATYSTFKVPTKILPFVGAI